MTIYGRKHLHTVIGHIHSKQNASSICGQIRHSFTCLWLDNARIGCPQQLFWFHVDGVEAQWVSGYNSMH